MMNNIKTFEIIYVILFIMFLAACSGASSEKTVVLSEKNGGYSYIVPNGWKEIGGDNAPSRLSGSVHYGRERNGGNETFSISVITNLATKEYIQDLKIKAETIIKSGNYTYYEYTWKSKEKDSVQYSRMVNYNNKWFGIGYSADNLNIKIGKTLVDSQIPKEIKKSIVSFRVMDDTDSGSSSDSIQKQEVKAQ